MKKVEEGNRKVLLYEVIFNVVLLVVALIGVNGAINIYNEPSIVEEIKPSLIAVQIIGVIIADIFLVIDLKRKNNTMDKIINYSIINVIYFMFVFIVDGDPIFNIKHATGNMFWWFDILEWIDLAAIVSIYFYIAYANKLNNINIDENKTENKIEEKIDNKPEENVENPKKNNKLIVIALLVWLVVSFIIFLRGDLLGIVSFGIAILAISIYGIIYMINI